MRVRDNRKTGSIDDLAQEGTLALLRALKRYDCERASFKWYAIKHIRGAMVDSYRKRGKCHQGVFQIDEDDLRESDRSYTVDYELAYDIASIPMPHSERDCDIVQRILMGETGRSLADEYAITESRVSQIVHDHANSVRVWLDTDTERKTIDQYHESREKQKAWSAKLKATKAATQDMLEKYRYGVALRKEAERYTLKSIGEEYGLSQNAIWARLKAYDVEPNNEPTYTQKLEARVKELESGLDVIRLKLANLTLPRV